MVGAGETLFVPVRPQISGRPFVLWLQGEAFLALPSLLPVASKPGLATAVGLGWWFFAPPAAGQPSSGTCICPSPSSRDFLLLPLPQQQQVFACILEEEGGFCFYCFSRNSKSLPVSCGHSTWRTTHSTLRLGLCRGEGAREASGALSLLLHRHQSPPRLYGGQQCSLSFSRTPGEGEQLSGEWEPPLRLSTGFEAHDLCAHKQPILRRSLRLVSRSAVTILNSSFLSKGSCIFILH